MKRVETYSNWGYWDRLDGKNLETGERLRIKFPDDHTEVVTVRVRKYGESYSDMGSPTTIPHEEAHASISYHGMEINIRLVGFMAERL